MITNQMQINQRLDKVFICGSLKTNLHQNKADFKKKLENYKVNFTKRTELNKRIIKNIPNKKNKMAAKFEESKKYEIDRNELFQSAIRAVEKCNFKVKNVNENEGQINAKTKLNWWSWTENINVKVEENGIVKLKSECSFPLQIFDWGKNERNVKAFFSELED